MNAQPTHKTNVLTRRIAALLIDSFLVAIIVLPIIVSAGYEPTAGATLEQEIQAYQHAFSGGRTFTIVAVEYLYFIILEWRFGATLGRYLLRIRVRNAAGGELTFGQAVARNLLRFIDQLPAVYLIGFVTAVLTKRRQRLGDLLARTVVEAR